MSKSIRILLIDPHPIFREGVSRTIARSDAMALVGEGSTAADARQLANTKAPDIVILDIAIAGGRDVIAELASCNIKCVVLTMLDDALTVSNAIAAGAKGYILKGVSGLELIDALKSVHAGQSYVTAELAARLVVGGSLRPRREAKVQAGLTYRERQLLEHLSKGYTNREIADRLGLTVATIKVYLTQLFKKLGVRNRVQAVIAARTKYGER
jgi:two-component system, NarL family, nitrate/nitrite response regulator NarL